MPPTSKVSRPVRPSVCRVSPGLELQRQHAHADQVAAVDALVALGDHRLTPSSSVPLAAQSRELAGAVLLAGDDDQRHALAW